MLIVGAIIGVTVAALTYTGECLAENKIKEHLNKKQQEAALDDDFVGEEDGVYCNCCGAHLRTEFPYCPGCGKDNPIYVPEDDDEVDDDEVFAEEVEPSDIFKAFKDDPEPVDVPEEEIKPTEEAQSSIFKALKEDSEDNKNDTHFMQGMTVRFKEHDLARTADGVNQIKDCNYKFISYDQDNPSICFITRGNKQRKFQVLVASLEPVNK